MSSRAIVIQLSVRKMKQTKQILIKFFRKHFGMENWPAKESYFNSMACELLEELKKNEKLSIS